MSIDEDNFKKFLASDVGIDRLRTLITMIQNMAQDTVIEMLKEPTDIAYCDMWPKDAAVDDPEQHKIAIVIAFGRDQCELLRLSSYEIQRIRNPDGRILTRDLDIRMNRSGEDISFETTEIGSKEITVKEADEEEKDHDKFH